MSRKPSKILVADDPTIVRAAQETALRRSGLRWLSAAGPDEALDRFRREWPDLLLVDADGWGAELRRRIASEAADRAVRLVLIAQDPGTVPPAGAREQVVVLPAPADGEALLGAIRGMLDLPERRSRRRALSARVAFHRGEESGTAYAKDLGLTGLFLRTREAIEPGELLQLVFELPPDGSSTIRATGEVVRRVPAARDSHLVPGVGIRFREMGARDRAEVERFVRGKDA